MSISSQVSREIIGWMMPMQKNATTVKASLPLGVESTIVASVAKSSALDVHRISSVVLDLATMEWSVCAISVLINLKRTRLDMMTMTTMTDGPSSPHSLRTIIHTSMDINTSHKVLLLPLSSSTAPRSPIITASGLSLKAARS